MVRVGFENSGYIRRNDKIVNDNHSRARGNWVERACITLLLFELVK